MPFDGSGNFVRVHNWSQDAANGLDINANEFDAEDDGIAGGLSNCVTRDGQGRPSADLLPNADNVLNLGSSSQRWASINGVPIASIASGIYIKQTAAEAAASVVPTVYQAFPGDPYRYGGDPTGVTTSDAAWASAVAQAAQPGGAAIIGSGIWKLASGIVITQNGVTIRTSGMGATVFKAAANNIILMKVSASFCKGGDFSVDANGFTGVEGLTLAPANEADTTHTSQINNNVFGTIQLLGSLKEGIRMRAGPTVTGVDSGCFFNTFTGIQIHDCLRTIWMENSVGGGAGAPNRNTFLGICMNSTGTVLNTGIQIDSGATNQFFGANVEGVSNGTVPNAKPTAYKVAFTGANGLDNNDNHFFGCFLEGNTIDLDNTNPTTCFFGGSIDGTKMACGIAVTSATISGVTATIITTAAHGLKSGFPVRMAGFTPAGFNGLFTQTVVNATTFNYTVATIPAGNATVIGTFDVPPRTLIGMPPGGAPNIDTWWAYGEGIPGYPSGWVGLKKELADLNKQWQTQTLTTGQVTNAASLALTTQSHFRQLANMASWHAVVQFTATAGGTNMVVSPPIAPNSALYCSTVTTNAFYSFFVEDGTGTRKAVEAGWTTAGTLYVHAPSGGWNTSAGNNNIIFVAIEYHL